MWDQNKQSQQEIHQISISSVPIPVPEHNEGPRKRTSKSGPQSRSVGTGMAYTTLINIFNNFIRISL